MDAPSSGNLPAEVTNFVGRQHDIAQLTKLLSTGRLITLTGPGGVGKSRLARRFGGEVRGRFADGVWLVELDGLRASDLLSFEIARALGIKDASSDPLTTLAEQLADKQLLLVIDNCEHMVDPVVGLVLTLLASAPGLSIVATSRQVLGAEGEYTFEVPPLPVSVCVDGDDGRAADAPFEALSDAAQLFVDRATAAVPNVVVDHSTLDAIAELCKRLEGMPLAIELAAARLRAYSVQEILVRLERTLNVLTAGPRSAPPRHRALRATIDWSFALCSSTEQLLWTRLSVFAGGFNLSAVEEVCSDGRLPRAKMFDLLASLVDKSVLSTRTDPARGETRFTMLETVREYGRDRLAQTETTREFQFRHLRHFGALAERNRIGYCNHREIDWFRAVNKDLPNLRVALQYCLDKPQYAGTALRIASCLRNYWLSQPGLMLEGCQWLQRALALTSGPTADRAEALFACSYLEVMLGDVDSAAATASQSRKLATLLSLDDITGMLQLCQILADFLLGDVDAALTDAKAAADRGHAMGNVVLAGEALTLAVLMAFALDRPEAEALGAKAREFHEREGSQMYHALTLWTTGVSECRAGRPANAWAHIVEAFEFFDAVGHDLGIVTCLEGFAWAAAIFGNPQRGARLLGAADVIWHAGPSSMVYLYIRQQVRATVETVIRDAIGENTFQSAYAEGARRDLHQLIAEAGDRSAVVDEPPTHENVAPLTRRELLVAELVSKGMTNSEIASELVLSRRTVESHVYHIFAKLQLHSRTQIAAWFTATASVAQ